MKKLMLSTAVLLSAVGLSAAMAETYRPECFAPAPETGTISYDAKEGPYNIAFVNGYAGNDWAHCGHPVCESMGCAPGEYR